MEIRVIRRNEINTDRWNELNDIAVDGSIYMSSDYLDVVCRGWSAIIAVDGDKYLAAVPWNVRIKMGFRVVLQPFFTQYFNLLFSPVLSAEEQNAIASLLLKKMKRAADLLVYRFPGGQRQNVLSSGGLVRLKKLHRYELDISTDFSVLMKSFSSSVINHWKKAGKNGLRIFREKQEGQFLQMCNTADYFQKQELQILSELLVLFQKKGNYILLKSVGENKQIHAYGLFVMHRDKMIFLASVVNRSLKHLGGNTGLIIHAMRFANKIGLHTFDFEGSMLPGPEKYFRGFRPLQVEYFQYVSGRRLLCQLEAWLHARQVPVLAQE